MLILISYESAGTRNLSAGTLTVRVIGLANDADGVFGSPAFEKAASASKAGEQVVGIRLK